jgi:hypothetical protein
MRPATTRAIKQDLTTATVPEEKIHDTPGTTIVTDVAAPMRKA